MAFNFDSFAAGFFETLSEGMDRREAEATKYKEKQEANAMRNLNVLQQRDQRAKQAAQLGKRAMALGATEEQVRTAMSSGVTGISEFYEKLQEAANQMPGKRLGPDDIEAIVNMPEIPAMDLNMADMSLQDFAARTYGVSGRAPKVDQEEVGFGASLLGFGKMRKAKQELSESGYMGEMSIADVNAAAAQAEYQSMFPDATLTMSDIEYYTPKDALDFSTTLAKTMSDAVSSSEGKAYIKAARQAAMDSGLDINEAETLAIKELQERASVNLINTYADIYKYGGFFDNDLTMRQIADVLSPSALTQFKETFGIVEAEDDTEESDTDMSPEGEGLEEGDGNVIVEEVTFEGSVSEEDFDEEFPTSIPLDEEGKAIVADALSSKSIFTDDEDKYSDKYTRDQWEDMTRKQRRERNLPESMIGGMNFYFRDDINELIEAPLRNLNIKRNLTKDTYKIKIKGRGTYHVTKEQLDSMDDGAFRGSNPAIEIMEYEEAENKAKNITSNILKRYQLDN